MAALTSEPVTRALAYLAILNESNVCPSPEHVDAFVSSALPETARAQYYSGVRTSNLIASAAISQISVESTSAYLLTTGMAWRVDEGLELTPVGLAFHLGIEKRNRDIGTAGDLLEVVGRLEDPSTYSRLLTEIDKQIGALIIDPYLPPAALLTLLELPNVTRILSKDTRINGQSQDERRRHLAITLGARSDVELRFLPSSIRELHDRYVIPTSGEGLMIGTSLGATQVTVMTHLGSDTTEHLRDHYEDLCLKADRLEPIERPAIAEPGLGNTQEKPERGRK